MINIDPYIQKLEWLKEWMSGIIDGSIFPVRIEFVTMPTQMSVEEIMRIFRQTGMMFMPKYEVKMQPIFSTFDEYYNYKQSLI